MGHPSSAIEDFKRILRLIELKEIDDSLSIGFTGSFMLRTVDQLLSDSFKQVMSSFVEILLLIMDSVMVMSISPTIPQPIPQPIPPKKGGFFQQHSKFRLDFIMKCQTQIDLHRVSGTSLNALAWKTVKDELNSMQDFHVLQHKELKNQWDYLKRQWQIWRGLINWTGHGYDPVSGTFDWPEEVWANIIAVNSEAKKYKTAPLQHRDLLEKLLDGLSATEDFAWSSGMASVPSSTQQSEYVPLPDDMNVDDTQVPLAGVDYPWDGEAISSYDAPISLVREPTLGSTSRSRTPAS
ncbi:hypothetical protein GIB67_014820 [Kingdonia uniflora]|uniref:Myb/SANT-like domain-containing protein n=1 Tax=Kingdonia uniflora TaxID=39325 RepID=A0A7J7MT08_9MAGN|nr:hypothetical protein GIB67_014820 [Kingdonia uniflora]